MSNDWIEWKGGAMPVPGDTLVDVKFRNGGIDQGGTAISWVWNNNQDAPFDIIAYRIVEPAEPPDRRAEWVNQPAAPTDAQQVQVAVELRDQYAMAALTGLVVGRKEFVNQFTTDAYNIADAMLEARKVKP